MDDEQRLKSALLKRALGYAAKEVVEEYLPDESGKPVLAKKKVTKKENPPDISALKLLLDKADEADYSEMTDEELLREKHRLLQLLKEKENEDEDGRM